MVRVPKISLQRWRTNSMFKGSIKRLPYFVDGKLRGAFSSKRERVIGEKNEKTYEGYMLCGAMSHIIYEYETRPFLKYIHRRGVGRHYEDHMFLKYKDIIVDPTYRQMFRSNFGTGCEDYFKLLYEDHPPFFVGTLDSIVTLYEDLNKQHLADFGEGLDESVLEFYTDAVPHVEKKVKTIWGI